MELVLCDIWWYNHSLEPTGDAARFGFEWHFDLIGSAGKLLRG